MARKAFLADVVAASEKNIPNVISISRGDDDGDINFCYIHEAAEPVEIGLLAMDISEYPSGNTYMIFAKSDGAPEAVTSTLSQLEPSSAGMRLPDLISNISQKLQRALATGASNDPVSIDDEDDEMEDAEDEESEDELDFPDQDEDFLDDRMNFTHEKALSSSRIKLGPEAIAKLNRRIRSDARAVRLAGFKIGVLSGMTAEAQSSILSISILAAKLGLSEEAMQAWDIEPQQYVVLLLRYTEGYKTFENIIAEPAKHSGVDCRIGVSNKYKPTNTEALSAFSDTNKAGAKPFTRESDDSISQNGQDMAGFFNIFISSSLDEFINTKMISLLKIREATGLGWEAAKTYFDQKQGRPLEHTAELLSDSLMNATSQSEIRNTSDVLNSDHLTDKVGGDLSFPLIAAQFASMYLVRCTEFCLVCHDKITGEFEALKPYVCSKPLCLYQYMSLGFGPSVEHEIQTQPYCVDLLLNFCYTSALANRIREFPIGMSLSVPQVMTTSVSVMPVTRWVPAAHIIAQPSSSTIGDPSNIFEIKFDTARHEVVFDVAQKPVREGDWVCIMLGHSGARSLVTVECSLGTDNTNTILHFRVADTSFFPTIKLSDTAVTQMSTPDAAVGTQSALTPTDVPTTPATTPPPSVLQPARLCIYNQNFDDLSEDQKRATIVMLLETLPSIKDMREYIDEQSKSQEPSLRNWKDRISPAALGLLRWIIASNRSCLIQVDQCPGQSDGAFAKAKTRPEQKVSQIADNWVQFRFAQGAPDKEQRFLGALKAQQNQLNPKYPTMFAFHGSPIHNWHSIIRHGLDFKDTLHGRAYGHGVYHAQDQNISCGYSQPRVGKAWPGSELKATSVMSINEIINCPAQFVSSTPYIVVQHIDWIQCRYLLVQVEDAVLTTPNPTTTEDDNTPPSFDTIEQDPKFTARAINKKAIGIPKCAATVSRAFRTDNNNDSPSTKKRKGQLLGGRGSEIISEEEDIEDIQFLLSDGENDDSSERDFEIMSVPQSLLCEYHTEVYCSSSTHKKPEPPKTDFVPGSLDQSSLPILESPAYATPSATMRLNRELQSILKVQNSTPLHELGWYIDESLVDNIYQWIVELHSFDPSLPLSKDLKEAGLTSVVLEIRFGKDYPHSPPFVRVVRPRFLPFMSGGGGHVTAGGALCMELLTNSGWSAVSSIESVLLQVRLALMSTDPKPARLQHRGKSNQRDYGTQEAMDAFIRACRAHGWEVPTDFQQFAQLSSANEY
ncbi:ubiquitin conjugating enzyme protein [Rutstroemia sp. NJR-2017a WRK4]|nr:ubiquitin conjugating enzyme protein [Rutstroemia sp. NJR-2017a WRK4]